MIFNVLFSPNGRAPRTQYWRVQTVWLLLLSLAIGLATLNKDEAATPLHVATAICLLTVVGAGLWSTLCTGIKRFHDRGKSGIWFLIVLVPVVGALWYIVEVGFLRGQDGPNRFGLNPDA